MEITFNKEKINQLKKILNIFKDLNEHFYLYRNDKKIIMKTMDSSGTSFFTVCFIIENQNFDEILYCKSMLLYLVISKLDNNFDIIFKKIGDKLNVIQITDDDKIEYELPLYDVLEENLEISPTEYKTFMLDSSYFVDILKKIDFVDTMDIKISYNLNELSFKTKLAKFSTKLPIDNNDENINIVLSLQLILKYSKLCSVFNDIIIGIKNDEPIYLCYEDNDINVKCYIAPKSIDDELM